jgi:hypothetical protein
MLATSGSSGRHARVSGRRSTARLAAGALAAAALLSGLAVTGFAGVANASAARVTLYATPSGGTSGCTSASPCSLSGAISVAGSSTYSGDDVTITLEHSTGLPCSASDKCTFSGTQSVSSGSEASLTIEGTATGSGSSADSVLDANGSGRAFTDSASFLVKLSNVTVTGGSANATGGGIDNNIGATMTVTDSTMSANSANDGGGIFNNGTMTVTDSTISDNNGGAYGGADGGGIYNNVGATMTVTDSTMSANSAPLDGGGIFNNSGGTMTVTDSTISDNSTASYGDGGGIFNFGSGPMTVAGSIVANQGDGGNCGGTVTDAGYNLSSDTSCGFGTGTGSKDSVTNLDLGTLRNYGGPTETVPLGFGSAAASAISGQATVSLGGTKVELCSDTSYTTASDYLANLSFVMSSLRLSHDALGYVATRVVSSLFRVRSLAGRRPVLSARDEGDRLIGDTAHLCDEVCYPAVVGDPLGVALRLGLAEPAGHRLAGDLGAPLPVRTV